MARRSSVLAATVLVVVAAGTVTRSAGGEPSLLRAGIYSVRDDGGDLRQIALPDPPVESLVRSPSGRLILFEQLADGSSALFAAERSGANPARLTPPDIHPDLDFGGGAAFAPDGRSIAFTSVSCDGWRCDNFALYVVGRDGTGLHLVAQGGRQPSWSRDGLRIAYTGSNGIYVADVVTGRKMLLGKGAGPVWAPHGERIAYRTLKQISDPYGDVCFVNADRSGRRCTHGHSLTTPLWSPDAKRVALRQAYPSQLTIVDASTRRFRYLGDHPNECPVAWAPAGKRIAIAYGCYDRQSIAVDVLSVDKPHRAVRVVHDFDGRFSDFRWRGSRITYVGQTAR